MGPGVALGLCGGEVECRETAQEFGASVEKEAGTVPAEIHRQRRQLVRVTGLVHQVKSDRECYHYSNCLAEVVVFPLAWYRWGGGAQFDLRLCCK
jgi:hypothetical protein